jgi:hypothetical protein
MHEFNDPRTDAALGNEAFLAKVESGKCEPPAFGLFAFYHFDTTMTELHFE